MYVYEQQNKNHMSVKNLYMNAHNHIINNNHKVEIT